MYCHPAVTLNTDYFKVSSIPVLCSDPIPFLEKVFIFPPWMVNDIILLVNVIQMLTSPSEMTSSKHVVDLKKGKACHVCPAATKNIPEFNPVLSPKGEDQPAWTLLTRLKANSSWNLLICLLNTGAHSGGSKAWLMFCSSLLCITLLASGLQKSSLFNSAEIVYPKKTNDT